MTGARNTFHALLRQDFGAFVAMVFKTVNPGKEYKPNWHVDAMVHQLTRVARGEVRQVIQNLPPRHLKSICASVAFPAWILGRAPTKRIICVSYGEVLAHQHAEHCRAVMESAWYRETFPATVLTQKAKDRLATVQHGWRDATTIGGPLTGLGADIIVIDDPIKVSDINSDHMRQSVNTWFGESLFSRRDDRKNSAIIISMQRLHEDDLVAHVTASGEWDVLSIPVISQTTTNYAVGAGEEYSYEKGEILHPGLDTLETIRETRAQVGERVFCAQYLQRPVPAGGSILLWEWFVEYDAENAPPFEYVIQSWDVASSTEQNAAYSVCTTWGVYGDDVFLMDVYRKRQTLPHTERAAASLIERYEPNLVAIEENGIGLAMVQHLKETFGQLIAGGSPKGSKDERAEAVAPYIERGQVHVPKSAPWLETFRNEVVGFPATTYKDQVDSMTFFLLRRERIIQLADRRATIRERDSRDETTPAEDQRFSGFSSDEVLLEICSRFTGGW